ncbi:MAG TPA: hypothetical protein VF292_13580 [Rhodanobacteraceae bacterium]
MRSIELAFALWLGIDCVALGVPTVLNALIAHTPNTLLAQAGAGRFESASASAGGFFARNTTTLQTTRGSFLVDGSLSLQRGQRLLVTHTLKDGTRLCVIGTPVCRPLAGPFAGHLVPVPHHTPRFAEVVTTVGSNRFAMALGLSMLLAFAYALLIATLVASEDDSASADPLEDVVP